MTQPARPSEHEPGSAGQRSAEAVERISPGAGELAHELATQFRRPGVVRACLSALIGALTMLGVGVLVAALFPEKSAISFGEMSLFKETLYQACAFTLAEFRVFDGEIGARFTPALFVLVPLLGTGIPAYLLTRRARTDAGARERIAWGAATGFPFALLMLVVALAAGETTMAEELVIEPSVGGVFLLSLLWGAIGGGAAVALACRPEERAGVLPVRITSGLQLVWAPLRALLLALAVTALIGTTAVLVQTVRDSGHIRENFDGERKSTVLASIDSALYAVEHGVHFNQLGAMLEFEAPLLPTALGLPLPVAKFEELGTAEGSDDSEDLDDLEDPAAFESGTFRIFDYRDALPAWAFVLLLGLIVIPALFALYAGFSAARVAAAGCAGVGAAWGALVGPLWALALVLVTALVDKDALGIGVFGTVDGDSVFVSYLLGGAALGAVGGLLGAQRRPATARPEAGQ